MSNPNHPATPHAVEPNDISPGLRLRRAREAAGLSTAEIATRLRLRGGLVEAIEREDLAALGAAVFARGYIDSYANLVGLPKGLADELLPREQAVYVPPPTQGITRHSRQRLWLDRLARRLVYVALTASIVIPVILLATREPLPDSEGLLAPLEIRPELAAQSVEGAPAAVVPLREEVGPHQPEQAVLASFTPYYLSNRVPPAAPVSPAPIPASPIAGLVLELDGESWIEVVDADGTRLVHDLLRAGTRRSFEAGTVDRVLIGNAAAVKVHLDGELIDIAPFQRANVARFAVSSAGLVSTSGE